MQHKLPIDPSSMTTWRQRVGEQRMAVLLKQTIEVAVRQKHLPKRELKHVNVDTTVQHNNVTYPTDSKLLHKAIVKLATAARDRGITLRQSYARVGKRLSVKAGRYAHAKQFKRMRRAVRQLRTYVGRLIRDLQRKTPTPDAPLAQLLEHCQRIRDQQRSDSNKLYSLHEPDTRCISKGKAHQRYEFGQKVAVATTNRRNWFVAAQLLPANPYDGHTLNTTLTQVESKMLLKVGEGKYGPGWIDTRVAEAFDVSIFEYIEVFYNRKRLHSALNYKCPEAFEASLN